LGRFSCAFCARAKLFPRLGPAARMDDIFFTRARAAKEAHGPRRPLAQVSTCKKDKIYSARLYKLEAFGRDNSPLVASPPPLAKTEGQRRTAPPETHTHQMNSFVRKRRANCLNTHLLRCSRENETLFFYSAAQLNYLLQTRGGERE
jgi:hypothetical protein